MKDEKYVVFNPYLLKEFLRLQTILKYNNPRPVIANENYIQRYIFDIYSERYIDSFSSHSTIPQLNNGIVRSAFIFWVL